jgi:hypothetical protein
MIFDTTYEYKKIIFFADKKRAFSECWTKSLGSVCESLMNYRYRFQAWNKMSKRQNSNNINSLKLFKWFAYGWHLKATASTSVLLVAIAGPNCWCCRPTTCWWCKHQLLLLQTLTVVVVGPDCLYSCWLYLLLLRTPTGFVAGPNCCCCLS